MTETLQVLILEDRPTDAELMATELRKSGFAVDWQRVDTLRDFRLRLTPNLGVILADYSLPGFTALDALKELNATGLDVPFIIVSGSIGDDRAVECLKLGATDYMLKDRIARLGPAVRRALSERADRFKGSMAQEALERSEQQMRDMLSTIDDVVFSISLPDFRLRFLNPAAEKICGRPVADFLANPRIWLDSVHPDDRASVLENQQRLMQWGACEYGARIIRPDGIVRHLSLRTWIAYGPDGKAAREEGIVTDVTDQKEAEARKFALETSRHEAERLQQLNAFKSHFLNMVAHDLNNVLTPMKINAKMVGDDLAKAGLGESKAMDRLYQNVNRITFFLADLLDASRLQAGKLTISPLEFDLSASLRQMLETITHQARAYNVQVDANLPDVTRILADPQRIEQVATNLLSNAVKFTPPGGTIAVGLKANLDKNEVEVNVTDTGPGISAEDIAKLFQPFTRLVATPQGKHTGTGLGLFISRGIIEGHGGKIWCESEGSGKGTTFRFTLPVKGMGGAKRDAD